MKRLLEDAEAMPLDELRQFCTEASAQLRAIYVNRAHQVTEKFFGTGADVFRGEVLASLARSGTYIDMLWLRCVCKRWAVWVEQIQHLRIDVVRRADGIFKRINSDRLLKLFPCVKSLSTSANALVRANASHFATCITNLEEVHPISNGIVRFGYSFTEWTCLQSLSLLTDSNYHYYDVVTLTQLTSLSCGLGAFSEDTRDAAGSLTKLTNLRQLTIRDFGRDTDISALTALTRLESDQPAHFARFTGHGVLDARAHEYETAMKEALKVYGPDCYRVLLDGRWCAGVFSGSAFVGYRGETGASLFIGSLVDGHRDGKAKEYDASRSLVRHGQWVQGKRHGIAICNRVSSVGRDTGQQMAFERWDHGVLIEHIELGDVDSASQWVDANYCT